MTINSFGFASISGLGALGAELMQYTWDQLTSGEVANIPPGQFDCETTATNRLWHHLEQTESWPKLFRFMAESICELEDLLGQANKDRYISTAYGLQLDLIGEMVRLPRNGASDELYAQLIKVEVQTLYSSGTIPEILDAAAGIITDGRDIELEEFQVAAFSLSIPNLSELEFSVLKAILCDMPAAGVAALLETSSGNDPGWDYEDPPDTDVLYEAGWGYDSGTDEVQSHWSYAVSFGDCN